MQREKIYFISDAHLGIVLDGYDNRQKVLLDFFATISSDAAQVVIAGDLFDFWIEYPSYIRSDYVEVVTVLHQLVQKGIEVHYCAGNHDFALGPFLPNVIGVHIHLDSYNFLAQGKKIHVYHGDGLIKADAGYRLLRKVLRNPINQKIYKTFLHPEIGLRLGTFFSGSSRKFLGFHCNEKVKEEYRLRARERLDLGNDIVVFGHTHHAEINNYNGKIFCNSGEWIRKYTYAVLDNGHMKLYEWVPEKSPVEIAPRSV